MAAARAVKVQYSCNVRDAPFVPATARSTPSGGSSPAPARASSSSRRLPERSASGGRPSPGARGRQRGASRFTLGLFLVSGALLCTGVYGLGQRRAQREAEVRSLSGFGYYEGLQLFARDRVDAFPQARQALLLGVGATAVHEDPTPLGTLAELSARWSEALRAQAREATTEALRQRLQDEADAQARASLDYAAELVAQRPAAPESQRALAAALCAQQGPLRAAEIEKRLRQAPVGIETTYLWSLLRARQGRSEEALGLLHAALPGGEAPVRALLLAATLEVKAGRPEAARRFLLQAQAQSPEHAGARAALAALRAEASPEVAVSIAAGGLHLHPTRAGVVRAPLRFDSQMELAQRYLGHGRAGDAERLLKQLQQDEGHDGDPDIHTGLGQAALMQERHSDAQEHFRAALSRRADYPPALLGLAEAARARGDLLTARDLYQRYLDKSPYGQSAVRAREQVHRLASLKPQDPPPAHREDDPPPVLPAPSE